MKKENDKKSDDAYVTVKLSKAEATFIRSILSTTSITAPASQFQMVANTIKSILDKISQKPIV